MKAHKLILFVLFLAIAALALQNGTAIEPLTTAGSKFDARAIVANQPDFVADLGFFVNEGFGGFADSNRVARKQSRVREESKYWIFLTDVEKSTIRLDPDQKTYDEMVPLREFGGANLLYPQILAENAENTLQNVGTVQVDGHKCFKIEVIQKGKEEKVYLYAAVDLKNLIIASEAITPKRSTTAKLTKISFDVRDVLFQVPSDYKPVVRHKWQKVQSAKVTYKGKPSNDYVVFRAPQGELFIRVGDAYYDWTYLYRPKNKTVEIAYEGELVDRSGTYIWQTKDTEAFSLTDYLKSSSVLEDAHLIQIPNGIRFRSNSYDKDQSVIEITW